MEKEFHGHSVFEFSVKIVVVLFGGVEQAVNDKAQFGEKVLF